MSNGSCRVCWYFILSPLDQCDSDLDVIGKMVANTSTEVAVSIRCWAEVFNIPPLSTFLLSDVSKLPLLVEHAGRYVGRYIWVCRWCVRGGVVLSSRHHGYQSLSASALIHSVV